MRALFAQMDLEEKINQMLQIPGIYYEQNAEVTGNLQQDMYTKKQLQEAGSVLGVFGAEKVKKIQKAYMESHPHHIPLVFMLDVIHGLRTIFPIPLAQGASFDTELTRQCAERAAREAAVSGVHVSFAPMADLDRDARWGRVMESYGEDPYLNGEMTAAAVCGFQGENVSDRGRIGACVKHFAAYGAPTAGRDYQNVELSEHTLREYYLPAYQKGIQAGAELVMTSFNTLNGIPSSGNEWLLRQVLRKEMGFDGVVISDWGALKEMIPHGFCEDEGQAAERAIHAGVDMDMASDVYSGHLKALAEENEEIRKEIDEAVWRILELKNRLGLFENPYKDADEIQEKLTILCREHRMAARKAARESFVLLKNEDQVLPIKKGGKTALIGPYLDCRDMHSAWAIAGDGKDAVTVMDAAREMEEYSFLYAPVDAMLDSVWGLSRNNGKDTAETEKKINDKEKRQIQEKAAVAAAREADAAVLFLGEHRLQSGEAASRTDITIPENQMELFRKVCRVNPNVTVVVFSGRPLDLREISEKAKGILLAWMPGTEGGTALMEVLSGRYSPSGKLPMSMPCCVGQVPVFYSQYATGRPMKGPEDPTFYRSRYLDCPNEPLYPFGFGLSYSEFTFSGVSLDRNQMRRNETVTASVIVENTGDREAQETVQLYIQDVCSSAVRPVKELKGFQKISLKSGERRKVSFAITEEMLRFHRLDGSFVSEPGSFRVWVGNSSAATGAESFLLLEE